MKVIFRDNNHSGIVEHIRRMLPEWDTEVGDIWTGLAKGANILVSPANCTGRMDGGIDQVYINRFGWQLEHRLMRDIRNVYAGKLPVGMAHLITTYDDAIPLMVCAPTMDWPPGDVSKTDNAYHAMRAIIDCVRVQGHMALGATEPVVLMPGLCTATGAMSGLNAARQIWAAWVESGMRMESLQN